MHKKSLKNFSFTLVSLILLLLFFCHQALSFSLFSVSEKEEIELGKVYKRVAIDEFGGKFPEREVQAYLEKLGQRIAAHSPRKIPYTFTLVNSDIENAFALPGGPVFITRGLFLMLDSESELVGVLGHEIGHIAARHHVRFVEKNLTLRLLLQIGSIFLPEGLTGEVLYQLAQISAGLLSLKFSRDQEREADALAFESTTKAGYSPEGMSELFRKFKEKEKKRPPEWLSTHPLPESRIKEWWQMVVDIKPGIPLIKDREEFHRIKNILITTNHSFTLSTEAGRLLKDKKYDLAWEKFQHALELYPKNIPALLGLSRMAIEQKRYEEARNYAQRARTLDPEFFSAYILEGIAELNLKNYAVALQCFEKGKAIIPFSGYAHFLSGRAYEELSQRTKAVENYQKALELGPKDAPWYIDCQRRYKRLRGEFLP